MSLRVVFDTSTVLSALLFPHGLFAWLRGYWREPRCSPLISKDTAVELARVLAYPKFRLQPDERDELLADYLACCEAVQVTERCLVQCRDAKDQPFLNLAHSGNASVLVSSDQDLLTLQSKTSFAIESPGVFALRVE